MSATVLQLGCPGGKPVGHLWLPTRISQRRMDMRHNESRDKFMTMGQVADGGFFSRRKLAKHQ